MSVLVDASLIGSAYLTNERDHAACKAYLDGLLDSDERRVLAAHTLIEAYVALTKRNRTPPAIAAALVRQLAARFDAVVALTMRDHLALLADAGTRRTVGPQTYDALIAAAARKAGVQDIATLNVMHFMSLWPSEHVIDPRLRFPAG